MTRMNDQVEDRRGVVEDALTNIGTARILIDAQVHLRIEQAIRRDCQLKDLLTPALEQIDQVDNALVKALGVIGDYWKEQSKNGW